MSRRTQLLVCVVFVAVVFVPGSIAASGLVPPAANENRPLTDWPSLGPAALFHLETYRQLTDFLTDRVPWRDRAIEGRERVSTSLFDETSSPSIVAGDGGWLYVADPLRAPCATAEETARLRADLAALAARFDAAGKQFRLLVVPDKDIAYARHVPARDRRPSCHLENSGALRASLGTLSPGYSSVAQLASDGPDLYYRGDEHWNARGAVVGARELVDSLEPGLFDPSAYRFEVDGELRSANLTPFQGRLRTERADSVEVVRPGITVVSSDDAGSTPGAPILRERRTGAPLVGGRVVVVHDSFGNALQPLVSPWLGDVTWLSVVAGRFDTARLAAAYSEADTVVVVLLERNLRARLDALMAAATAAFGPPH